MKISVIIPCHNAEDTIEKAITCIFSQSLELTEYEVIVVDDGSTDNTPKMLKTLQEKYPFQLVVHEHNMGVATTRNTGLAQVKNELTVYIQDDIYVPYDFLSMHRQAHENRTKREVVVVGKTVWYEGLEKTPFIEFLDHSVQFDFERFDNVVPDHDGLVAADYLLFYTPNVSLKTDFLHSVGGFDEKFAVPGSGVTVYEDTELAWRLKENGMIILYAPAIIAEHDHVRTLESIKKRKYLEGLFSHLLFHKHPQFSWAGEAKSFRYNLAHLKLGAILSRYRFILVLITTLIFNPIVVIPLDAVAEKIQYTRNIPLLFKIVLGYQYNLGYWKGLRMSFRHEI